MKDDTITSCLGILLGFVVAVVVGSIANGWALSTVWNWFIPPLFHITTLTFFQAIGVSMVFSLFTGTKSSSSESSPNKTFGEVVVTVILERVLTAVLIVLFAWIVYQIAF